MRTVVSYLKMARKEIVLDQKAHHRVEVGQDEERAFKHKQNFWYSFSYLVPKNFKFYRKQSVFQFHSTEGPYNPPFQIEVMPKHGLTVKISTYEDVLPTTEGDCGGSIKVKVNYCENILLEYIVLSADDLDKLTGTWIDFVIHSVWDKRPSDDNKKIRVYMSYLSMVQKNYIMRVKQCGEKVRLLHNLVFTAVKKLDHF